MTHMIQLLGLAILVFCSWSVFAATIPSDSLGAQKFDFIRCVSESKQDCINRVCLTSTDRNCQGNCEELAKQRCRQQQNE